MKLTGSGLAFGAPERRPVYLRLGAGRLRLRCRLGLIGPRVGDDLLELRQVERRRGDEGADQVDRRALELEGVGLLEVALEKRR